MIKILKPATMKVPINTLKVGDTFIYHEKKYDRDLYCMYVCSSFVEKDNYDSEVEKKVYNYLNLATGQNLEKTLDEQYDKIYYAETLITPIDITIIPRAKIDVKSLLLADETCGDGGDGEE